ncbi:MAG: hypothetical protein DRQ51_10430 [Gammaproteobacteria bacterium]|nr:MAG: hypothetical protein DRQ51_10430 [Gammaproteobacteria bacterium]
MVIQKLVTAFFVLMLLSCGGKSETIRGDSGDYDRKKYLVATGIGDNEEIAKSRARSNLAKIFEVEINSEEGDFTKVEGGNNGTESFNQRIWSVSRDISTYTNKALKGSEIANVSQDDDKTYKAVALITRAKASVNLRQQISQLDRDISRYSRNANAQRYAREKILQLYSAYQLQNQRSKLQNSLAVVDNTGIGSPSVKTADSTRLRIIKIMQKTKIFSSTSVESALNMDQKIQGSLSYFQKADSNTDADYSLIGNIKLVDIGQKQGAFWKKALITLNLQNRSGKVLKTLKIPLKAGSSLGAKTAEQKIDKQISSELSKQVMKLFLESDF